MHSTTAEAGLGEAATVAFVDLAGFSAIAEVFGDEPAVALLDLFEEMVGEALGRDARLVKWIGDEAMLEFADPVAALEDLGRLLPACRAEPRLPLTRTALHHGPIVRRGDDLFGTTVNLAARLAARATPGGMLATEPVATSAKAQGVAVEALGLLTLRSIARPVAVWSIALAPVAEPRWIDPVCKMHAPWSAYATTPPSEPWFCSETCERAWRSAPQAYPWPPPPDLLRP